MTVPSNFLPAELLAGCVCSNWFVFFRLKYIFSVCLTAGTGMESITPASGDSSLNLSVFEPGSYSDSRRLSASALQNLFR